MLPDHVLVAAARAPGGLLDLGELAVLGYGRRRVAEWAASGLLERVVRGLYRVAAAPVPAVQCLHLPVRCLARAGAPKGSALISGEAGLALRAVEGFTLPCRPLVVIDRSRTVRLANPPFDVRYVRLERVPVERVQGLDTTDAAQAVADAALNSAVSDQRLRVAFDDLRSRGLVTLPDLVGRWQEVRHVGARRMLAMAPALEHESEGERVCFGEVFRRVPPAPDSQVVLLGRLRVDFVFLFAALIVEYHGAVHDGQADRDASRTYALERIGYRIVVVTRSMLRHPVDLAHHIHELRRERERLVLEGRLARPPLPAQPPRLTPLRTLVPLG